ncbi:MAG: hypothetical protein SLAVMIC_00567 [uncultured marine phage]|uniref:Uncharacterized protein n=1 Tax=uncultured marine phage TaxID=707152 RepID=A0A8D9FQW2_9VIRU|nr:MAG: hypothetical protein SLAVMIC_00567 [uncultured marine phage]
MKHIKTFESYKETDIDLSLKSIRSLVGYDWNPNVPQIWRGLNSKDGEMLLTHIYRREDTERSIKGGMWGIIGEYPSWRNFTNRTRAIVATTDKNYSDGWVGASLKMGESYVVVPLKDEIYVGVNQDFNLDGVLPYFKKITGLESRSYSFIPFLNDMYKISKYVEGKEQKALYRWDELKQAIDRTHEGDMIRLVDNLEDFSSLPALKERYAGILKFLKEHRFGSINEMMDYLVDPIRNGYRKMKYTDYIKELKNNPGTTIEVWFECDCYIIKQSDFNNIKEIS